MIFDDITAIAYEGQGSTNPLAFKYYVPDSIY
jgi:xylose isomerase